MPASSRISRRTFAAAAGSAAALAASNRLGLAQEASPAVSPAAAAITPYNGEEVTITYGFWDTAQEEAVKKQLEAFKQVFPNITVEPQIVPWADYWTKLQTGVAGGETFDVFWINSASLPVYASKGALLPITQIVGGDGIDTSQFAAPLVEMYTYQDVHYGIPRDFDTIALFYNKDLFDAAGVDYPTDAWTWDDFRAAAEKLNNKDSGIFGAGLQTSWQENYYNFIYQNEGKLLSDDMKTCLINEAPDVEAIDFLTGFFRDELTPSIAVQQSNPVADTLFPAGQVAMMTGGSFRAGTYAKADANIDVAPLPKGKVQATLTHGLANVIWANGASAAASLELVKWLAGSDAETILGESGATIPALADHQDAWLKANEKMNAQVFIDALDYAQKVPDPAVGFEWQIAVQTALIDGWGGDASAQEMCDAAAKAANAVL